VRIAGVLVRDQGLPGYLTPRAREALSRRAWGTAFWLTRPGRGLVGQVRVALVHELADRVRSS